jgi:hypothetical protein
MDDEISRYIDELLSNKTEDSFFALLEISDIHIPILIEKYRLQSDATTQAFLVEVIWNHRMPTTLNFLIEALRHNDEQVWKSALDGIVSIGGTQALELLNNEMQDNKKSIALVPFRQEWIREAIDQIKESLE